MEPELRHKPIRYYEIDLLRFIAAIAVVLFHLTYRGYYADNLSPVRYPILGEVFKYGYMGVELFFMISGYVILLSATGKTVGQFFRSRFTRLYPAYWVACTLTFFVVRLFGPAVHAPGWSDWLDAPVGRYLLNMTMLNGFFGVHELDGVYWTLLIELTFYFLIAVFIGFGWLKNLPLVLAVWLAYCAFAASTASGTPFGYLLFPVYAPLFVAGMVFYLLQTSQEAKWKLYALLAAAYLLSLRTVSWRLVESAHSFHQPESAFSQPIGLTLLTSFFLVFLLIIHGRIRLKAAWLAKAGAVTYPIYLFHHNIGYVVLQRFGGQVDRNLLLCLMLAVLLPGAYAVHKLIEKPFSKALNQWLKALTLPREK